MRYVLLRLALIATAALLWTGWLRRLARPLGRAIASVALLSLMASCSTTRRASEVSSSKIQVSGSREARDSLREEISRNVNENVAEHEVVTWTVAKPGGDTMKVERVTERTKFQVSSSTVQDSKMAVRTLTVRDTVYVAVRDTVESFRFQGSSGSLNPHPSPLILLMKWIFWILCAIVVLIITVRIGMRRSLF